MVSRVEFIFDPMKTLHLNRSSALFLQVVVGLIGVAALTFLLWEPHLEGRNAHATTFAIYFQDPFLAYVYAGSIPFFVALQRAFTLFEEARRTGAFSPATLSALRLIRRCALTLLGFVAGGLVWILLLGDPDDRPAGFFLGLLVALGAGILFAAAARFARNVQAALTQPGAQG